jgi:hypothetical protein
VGAECRYANCRYAERRGAPFWLKTVPQLRRVFILTEQKFQTLIAKVNWRESFKFQRSAEVAKWLTADPPIRQLFSNMYVERV